MTKYIKVTDSGHVGYHSVPDDFRPPVPGAGETYEFIDEAEALEVGLIPRVRHASRKENTNGRN